MDKFLDIVFLNPDFITYYTGFITIIGVLFLVTLIYSVYKNRSKLKFASLIMREGKISKIGVSFIFFLYAIMYQAVVKGQITPGLTEVFILTLLLELGNKGIDVWGARYGIKKPFEYDYNKFEYVPETKEEKMRQEEKKAAKPDAGEVDFDKL